MKIQSVIGASTFDSVIGALLRRQRNTRSFIVHQTSLSNYPEAVSMTIGMQRLRRILKLPEGCRLVGSHIEVHVESDQDRGEKFARPLRLWYEDT